MSRDKVLKTALRIADVYGVESLSMRRLAQELNVEAMSLYNHVANKEELLDGIVDRVAGEFAVPADLENWQTAMRSRAKRTHAVLLQHPWAALLLLSRVCVGPRMLAYANATLGCLREAGFSFELADHAWNAMDNHIYGFTLQQINTPIDSAEFAQAAEHYLPLIHQSELPYLHAMVTRVSEGVHSGVNDFEFGLDLILQGLERLRSNQRSGHA